ncbi:MAG TPA: tetratricopeptide repeat protein, partial [Candidatus Hydrogenedentes bacterium]|nr:tetratricopeptide repeat protein [Candidatus Hydrogenedentota bacterium]
MNAAWMLLLLLGVDSFARTFEQANDAYARQAYAEAAQGYESLIAESIEDSVVFFNLGNAYYKLDRLGCAIANYERALRLDPGMTDARENLTRTLLKTRRKLNAPAPAPWARNLFFWHYDISHDATRVLAAACWTLFWALLAVRLWRKLPYLHGAIIAAGVLALAFGGSAGVKA